jgi:hypothetical protein
MSIYASSPQYELYNMETRRHMYISISILEQLIIYGMFVGYVALTAVTVNSTIVWGVNRVIRQSSQTFRRNRTSRRTSTGQYGAQYVCLSAVYLKT